ncbi:hypothetical protein SCMU_10030 [Sinomonas cyclohexanicum]|uniref:Uncharacterized protein n=1 Tax=Sinomonas cyclohexanicum TaxID=322009 RepID=A0ABM7PSF9_SINCY|nr:hypothetical protein SCMU_10030 [Corynebacterium cyclohexanicum]
MAQEVLRRKAIGELRQDLGQLVRLVVAVAVCTVAVLACRSAGSHGIPGPAEPGRRLLPAESQNASFIA